MIIGFSSFSLFFFFFRNFLFLLHSSKLELKLYKVGLTREIEKTSLSYEFLIKIRYIYLIMDSLTKMLIFGKF